jgi:hypothetical protein
MKGNVRVTFIWARKLRHRTAVSKLYVAFVPVLVVFAAEFCPSTMEFTYSSKHRRCYVERRVASDNGLELELGNVSDKNREHDLEIPFCSRNKDSRCVKKSCLLTKIVAMH